MSSLLRRIQRQVVPSVPVLQNPEDVEDGYEPHIAPNPPRKKFFNLRGSKLGTKNPKDSALVARLAREKRNKARKAT